MSSLVTESMSCKYQTVPDPSNYPEVAAGGHIAS